ncbi:MAG: TolC family protein [Bacteroidota bacterium]
MLTVKKLFLLLLLFCGATLRGESQSTLLEDYVALGLENNLALKQENLSIQESLASLRQAKGLFKPSVSFDASYTLADGGRTIDVPIGDLLNPVYGSLNQLSGSESFPTNLPNASEQLFPNDFHDTRFQFKQPLFNTSIYYNYKAKETLISVAEAQRDVYERELIKEIRKGYYAYLQTLAVLHIYDSTETVLNELIQVNRVLVVNNKATKDILYSAEFELSDLYEKRSEAVRQNNVAKTYFNFLLNRDLSDSILVDNSLNPIISDDYNNLSLLQELAVDNRKEIKQVERAKEATGYVVKLNEKSRLPEIGLGGAIGYQGFGYEFDSNQDYALLQFNLSLPLFEGSQKKARIQKSKVSLAKIELQERELKQSIKLQVVDAYHNLQAAQSKVISRAAAARSAEESFKIIKRKYEESQVLLVEFLDARTKYTNSQIDLAIANYDLLIKEEELKRSLSL